LATDPKPDLNSVETGAVAAALGWLALQVAAFVLDNLEGES